ncbi:MAG: sorbosone dehydrogenase family protein [Candidatus Dormibacteria bacterium]
MVQGPALTYFRRLPRALQVGIPGLALVLAAAAAAVIATHPKVRTPMPAPSGSPTPGSQAALARPSPAASAATATVPSASAGPCTNPAGGFPGDQLPAAYPVALAWSPDGRLFWAERAGAIRVYQAGAVHTFAQVATVTTEAGGGYSERGLLGLALTGNLVFAMYSNTDYATQTIMRWTDCGGTATNPTVIAAGLPAGADCCHKGGRLAISPDNHLFVTIGDNHNSGSAQAAGDLRGKVTRFNPDGSGRTVWTSGLRNPFGIAFAPNGTMALTNNGPSGDAGTPCGGCGDEFYLVGSSPGVDYQWPLCWGYSHTINGNSNCGGHPGPQYSTEGGPYAKSAPFFVAPTGMTWSSSRGAFVFCANSNAEMYQYTTPGGVVDTGVGRCSLDVKQGPDGTLYSSTSSGIFRH